MLDPSEYILEKTPAPDAGVRQPRSPVPWLMAATAILVMGAVVWFFVSGRQAQPPVAELLPSTGAVALPTPPTLALFALCGTTDAIALPSLDDSDAIVGTLVGALSAHPRVTAWLATDNFIPELHGCCRERRQRGESRSAPPSASACRSIPCD